MAWFAKRFRGLAHLMTPSVWTNVEKRRHIVRCDEISDTRPNEWRPRLPRPAKRVSSQKLPQQYVSVARTDSDCTRRLISVHSRPHRSTAYADAAYCYRRSSVVCLSVCLSVCHDREPCKNGWTDRDVCHGMSVMQCKWQQISFSKRNIFLYTENKTRICRT